MKRFLPLLIVLVSFTQAYSQSSQLLMSENFTGYTNGNLNTTYSGQGGTYPWTAAEYYSTDFAQVAKSNSLYYPNYTSGTQYVNLTQGADDNSWPWHYPDDPSKKFISNTSLSLSAATTFYMSFVVKVPSSSGVQSTNNARPELALRTNNGDNIANFYIADANSGNSLKFGISKDNSQDGTYVATNFNFNTTYLIVIRYDVVMGSNNDKMYMWVNPVLTGEPTTASAGISIVSNSNSSSNTDGYSTNGGNAVNQLQLFQEQNSATASLDAFKVAYAKNFSTLANTSLAAWNALSPIGTPLPVKFGDIKGYAKSSGVQVDWTVYTELNVNHYEIERSTDGVSFSTAGSVVAQNTDGTLYYNWYDATPSPGNNFYRIKNADNDGKSSYSSVVRVSLDKSTTRGVSVYPNPVTGNHISFQAAGLQRGDYTIEITNMAGQQVYTKQLSHAGGAVSQSIQLPSSVKAGIYNISIRGVEYKITKAFLVQ